MKSRSRFREITGHDGVKYAFAHLMVLQSPSDLAVDFYADCSVTNQYPLTPEEADVAFAAYGESPYSAFRIDPLMGTPGAAPQETVAVSEPSSTLSLLALGMLSARLAQRFRSMKHRCGSPDGIDAERNKSSW